MTSRRLFIEAWLTRALPPRDAAPARLHSAMYDAVFPGGARARPLLCRFVAEAYGAADDELVGRLCAALELLHCASLVQDDLPHFDDAATRRGEPACHVAHGAATAILVGDALLSLAFETLAAATPARGAAAVRLVALVAGAVGSRTGVIGGQALELEPAVDLARYHRFKTAALFRAAAEGAALAAGADEDAIGRASGLGELLGCAVQLRDDLDDVAGSAAAAGKPIGRDAALGRPNAALRLGVDGAAELRANLLGAAQPLLYALPNGGAALAAWAAEVTATAPRARSPVEKPIADELRGATGS